MNGYSDRALVADSIVGVRGFMNSGSFGFLRGPVMLRPWSPGVNVADCDWPVHHQVGSLECSCGFYAANSTKSQYIDTADVMGIVRGTGVVTVGSLGFRAEKAEIVALVDPTSRGIGASLRGKWNTFRWWVFDRPLAYLAWALPVILALIVASVVFWAPTTLLALFGIWMLSVHATVFPPRGGRAPSPISEQQLDAIKQRYPDIPWFPSIEAAVKRFPLSPPPSDHTHQPQKAHQSE